MTSLQSQSSNNNLHGHIHNHAKITKARSRQAVKPILKKLGSHSEKNSLDLDRTWQDQNQYGLSTYASADDDSAPGSYGSSYPTKTARDVSFSISATELSTGGARPSKYSHTRSTSGTSHVSVATNNSGRNGSFIHPFQQTPRTSTPPLSYANSLVSLDNGAGTRDYSPTITEDDDDDGETQNHYTSRTYPLPPSLSRPRRPSLVSQRTSSLLDVNQPPRMTSNTRSNSGTTSRITQRIVTKSRSDLHLNTASSTALESIPSTTPPGGSFMTPQMIAGSSSSTAMSPLRSSLEVNNFRLRSRSEVDTATRQVHVREARRKYEEKEKAKEEKYTREQIRKQERADNKEAHRLNKGHSHGRKSSFGHSRMSCDQISSTPDIRPMSSRKNTLTGLDSTAEKMNFATQGYDTVPPGQTPRSKTDGVHFEPTKRSNTAKRRTNGAWTAFVLWFRTRLLKLGRR